MNISIPDCFMIAFTVGMLFGLVYEALRIIRLILRFKAAVFICDILFFLLSSFAVMALSKILGNYVRSYTVLGFGAGVFCYIATIGRLLNLAESAASVVWRKTIGKLLHNISVKLGEGFSAFKQKAVPIIDKCSKDMQKHLKFTSKIVYNKNEPQKAKESEKAHVIQAKVNRSS